MQEIDHEQESELTAQEFSRKHHGARHDLFKLLGIPEGWVINGYLPDEVWRNIRAHAIPIEPGGNNEEDRDIAARQLSQIREEYREDAVFMIIPDRETEEGWSVRPVLPSDLEKDPDDLIDEACKKTTRCSKSMKKCLSIVLRNSGL